MQFLTDAEVRELFRTILANQALIMGALCALPACHAPEPAKGTPKWGTGEIGAMPMRWDDKLRAARADTQQLLARVLPQPGA